MKKSFAILLLLSLSFYITGYHLFFQMRQWQIKSAVKRKLQQDISNQNTEQFVFSLTEQKGEAIPEWEGDDEFRMNGEMYDVLERKIENGKIIVRCISDKEETRLIKEYRDISGNDFGGSSKKGTVLLLKLINTLYVTGFNYGYDDNLYHSRMAYRIDHTNSLAFTVSEVLTPPPQVS
ncbi:MAG: hypothetical protein ABUT20_24010 [Bacteroidota bacterium]